MTTADIEIRREELASQVATDLISALNEELSSLYPEAGANHFRLDHEEVTEGRGAFLVAYHLDEPVGCGAIRRLGADTAELKRMFVKPTTRGLGVGRAMLEALEREALGLGVERMVLETGQRQLEAIGLYETSGFQPIPRFGEYLASPLSLCMEKRL